MTVKQFSLLMICWLILLLMLKRPQSFLQIIICDVGQGDAILIQYQYWQLLIDGGEGDEVLACLDEQLPLFDKTIEIVLSTHPHADHIGGLRAVLEGYSVTQMISNGQPAESDDFKQLEKVIQRKVRAGMHSSTVKSGDVLTTPTVNQLFKVSVLSPLVDLSEVYSTGYLKTETQLSAVKPSLAHDYKNYNDGSIALLLQYGQVSALLMGDLEKRGEQALLEEQLITDVDILKVGHHGSKTSTTPGFLEYSRPEISLISLGRNNSFGHPSPQVISLLEEIDSEILRTDLEGTIVLFTDGSKMWRSAIKFNVKELPAWLSFHHLVDRAFFFLSLAVQKMTHL